MPIVPSFYADIKSNPINIGQNNCLATGCLLIERLTFAVLWPRITTSQAKSVLGNELRDGTHTVQHFIDHQNTNLEYVQHCYAIMQHCFAEELAPYIEQSGGKLYLNAMPAGYISLHADLLVHGSQPNHSSRRRCGKCSYIFDVVDAHVSDGCCAKELSVWSENLASLCNFIFPFR